MVMCMCVLEQFYCCVQIVFSLEGERERNHYYSEREKSKGEYFIGSRLCFGARWESLVGGARRERGGRPDLFFLFSSHAQLVHSIAHLSSKRFCFSPSLKTYFDLT